MGVHGGGSILDFDLYSCPLILIVNNINGHEYKFIVFIFIHQHGVMITDGVPTKMLMLPFLFTPTDRAGRNYPQLMLIQVLES